METGKPSFQRKITDRPQAYLSAWEYPACRRRQIIPTRENMLMAVGKRFPAGKTSRQPSARKSRQGKCCRQPQARNPAGDFVPYHCRLVFPRGNELPTVVGLSFPPFQFDIFGIGDPAIRVTRSDFLSDGFRTPSDKPETTRNTVNDLNQRVAALDMPAEYIIV